MKQTEHQRIKTTSKNKSSLSKIKVLDSFSIDLFTFPVCFSKRNSASRESSQQPKNENKYLFKKKTKNCIWNFNFFTEIIKGTFRNCSKGNALKINFLIHFFSFKHSEVILLLDEECKSGSTLDFFCLKEMI